MVHTYDVYYLHDDAPLRLASVCYLDVFRYTNGGQIGFVINYRGKAVPVYLPASLIELVSYAPIPINLLALAQVEYIARVEITLTDGRVFALNVLPEGGTSNAAPFLPFCSCSTGPPTADAGLIVYLKETGTSSSTVAGGPPSFSENLPSPTADGVWRVSMNLAWEVRTSGMGVGVLPTDRGDNLAMFANNVNGLLAGNQFNMSVDGSIGETINAGITQLDGNVALFSDFPVAAGASIRVGAIYRRQNYIDSVGDPLTLSLNSVPSLNGPAGAKYWGVAVFTPVSNPIQIVDF